MVSSLTIKRSLISFLFILYSFYSFSQVTIFQEDFESDISMWSLESSGTTNWIKETSHFNGGTSCAHNNYTPYNTNYLTFKNSVNLQNYTTPKLTFYHIAKTQTTFDQCYVEVSLDGGTTWNNMPVTTYVPVSTDYVSNRFFHEASYSEWGTSNSIPPNTVWKKETFNLVGFPGDLSNVKFRFRLTSEDADYVGWYIDDIMITGISIYNSNSKIEAGITAEPATISSLENTAPGIFVFDFKFTDEAPGSGTSDNVPTMIDKMSITQGDNNDFTDWNMAIAGAVLYGPDLPVAGMPGVISSTKIEFIGDNFIYIENNTNETYELKIWLKTNYLGGNEGDNFEFNVAAPNIVCDPFGSVFSNTQFTESGNTFIKLSVLATQLTFIQQPVDAYVNTNMVPAVVLGGTDIYGNTDKDFNGCVITVTSTGTMIGDPLTSAPTVAGKTSIGTIKHGVVGTGFTLTATWDEWSVTSTPFSILSSPCGINSSTNFIVDGEMKLCAGGSVNNPVSLSGTWSGAGSAIFNWEFGDGFSATGQNVTHTFTGAFGYNVKLMVDNGVTSCQSELKIMASPGPVIGEITPDISFCLGNSYELSAGAEGSTVVVSGFEGTGVTALSMADTTYLPDSDDNESYTTTLTYTQFDPGAVLDDVTKLAVYVNLEHSWFGDLEIEIKCPDGSEVHMMNGHFGVSNNDIAFLGEPVYLGSIDDGIPGVGYDYRWTDKTPNLGTMEASVYQTYTYTDLDGNTHTNQPYIPAGTYKPYDTFNELLNCPLNGNWTITVTDNIGRDDGFIFRWGLELDPSLMPSTWDYETYITKYIWSGPGISPPIQLPNVTVTPPNIGPNIYTLTVKDNFQCTSSQKVTINVTSEVPIALPDVTTCDTTAVLDAGAGFTSYVWKDIFGVVIGNEQTVTVSEDGKYFVTVSDGICSGTDAINVTLGGFDYTAPEDPTPFCEGSPASMLNAGLGYVSYIWTLGADTVATTRLFSPTLSGTYDIEVKNMYGCSSSDDVTVTVLPSPTVGIISSDLDNKLCNGNSITLSGTGANSYTWTGGITNGNSFNPSTTTTYIVTGTAPNSCQDTAKITVEVFEYPNIVVEDIVACGTSALADAEAGFTSYIWTNSAGDTLSTAQTLLIENEGIYSIEVANSICYSSDNFNVELGNEVYNYPSAPPSTFCYGNSATLNAGSGFLEYEWSFDNEVVGTSQTLLAAEPGTYTITVKNTNNCYLSDQVEITVFEPAEITITSSDTDNEICLNEPITLTASGSGNYNWNNSVQNGVQFYPTVTKTYTVTGLDVNGCQSDSSIEIIVNPLTEIQIADNDFCSGGNITIDAPVGFEEYEWLLNGNPTGLITSSITVSTPGSYTVNVVDNNGCSNSDAFTVTEHENPVISVENEEICFGDTFTFDAGSGFSNYLWLNSLNLQVGTNSTFTTSTEGNYSITVENEFECSNTDEFALIVNQLPEADAGEDKEICKGEAITLIATGGTIYEWNFGVSQGVEFIPNASNIFTVTVTDENDCFATDDVIVTVNDNPEINTDTECEMCFGDTISLDAGDNYSVIQWSTGQGTRFIDVTEAGVYTLTVKNEKSCTATVDITLTINPLPIIDEIYDSNLGEFTVVASGENEPLEYQINEEDFTTENIFSNLPYGYYSVTIKDTKNCTVNQLFLVEEIDLFIPQMFTPNFDGVNDTWEIDKIRAFPEATLNIYDRFGKLLSTYGALDTGWDGTYRGKTMPSDSYWYVIDLKGSGKEPIAGFVTIKR